MEDKTLTATQADRGEVHPKGDLPQWDENKREIKNDNKNRNNRNIGVRIISGVGAKGIYLSSRSDWSIRVLYGRTSGVAVGA